MIATLKFNLPEEDGEYMVTLKAYDFYRAILSVRELIRAHEKYEMPIQEAWDEIKEKVYEVNTDDIS